MPPSRHWRCSARSNDHTAMKKKITVLVAVLVVLGMISGACSMHLARPETNLEFWIAEKIERDDFSAHQPKHGLMGGREYYGMGYTPTTNENGEQIDPAQCVIYTVTSYPDYAFGSPHVTRICITDPTVTVYGLSMRSKQGDIESTMKKKGFKIRYAGRSVVASKGRFEIFFSEDEIMIRANVTNIMRVQF